MLDEILAARANGAYFRVHGALRRLYQYDTTRAWLEPAHPERARRLVGRPRARGRSCSSAINNEVFALDALRPMAAADMAAASGAALDFDRNLPTSVLPEMLAALEDVRHQGRVRPRAAAADRRPARPRSRRRSRPTWEAARLPGGERRALPRRLGRSRPAALDLRGRRPHRAGVPAAVHGAVLPEEPGDLPVTFHSLDFVVFFAALLRRCTGRCRTAGRTSCCSRASYVFYGWVHPWFLALIVATTLIDYGSALGMDGLAAASEGLPVAGHRLERRPAGVLQVLRLLRRQRLRGCWRWRAGRCRARC